jgi:hypothetical protein
LKTEGLAEKQIGLMRPDADSKRDLISALAGGQAGRERVVGRRTRRVVLTSLGVMNDQKAGSRRSRSLAIAAFLLAILAVGPFFWHVAENLLGGEHMSDIATQTSLWVCFLCPALLAAALLAGWRRK